MHAYRVNDEDPVGADTAAAATAETAAQQTKADFESYGHFSGFANWAILHKPTILSIASTVSAVRRTVRHPLHPLCTQTNQPI